MQEIEQNDNIDFEIVLRGSDPRYTNRFDLIIDTFASDFGITGSDKLFFLRRICKFRNPNFPKGADKYQIIEELTKLPNE